MTCDGLPDCHNYPPVDTQFTTMQQFLKFKKMFCHMRNATFQSYNNNSSAIYLCPNYKTCRGVLHGFRNKIPIRNENGSLFYDRNGYLKYNTLPHLTIGPLTNPCNCIPDRYTAIEDMSQLFERMLQTTNISRTEFNHLGNSYFAISGKNGYKFRNTGYNVTWNCLLCKKGCLQLTMNRNATTDPSKYQSYGTITMATPCCDDCPSHTSMPTRKTVWLPLSHSRDDMALTSEQITAKKEQHDKWVEEARIIAQGLLTKQEIQKKPWKLNYMTEQDIRKKIEDRNAKISESSKN